MADVEGVPQLLARFRAIDPHYAGPAWMKRLVLATVDNAKRELKPGHGRKTSNLSRSIQPVSTTATEGLVVATAAYAAFVELGTRPHVIRPRYRKMLRWAATGAGARLSGTPRKAAQRGELGGLVFARKVNHPGTRPIPYLVPGAKKAIEDAGGSSGILADIVKDWNGAA